MMRHYRIGFWSVALAVALATTGAQAASFEGLGGLPGDTTSSNAYAVSADGSVVVGVDNSGSNSEAFRWTAVGGMIGLGDLPGGFTYSYASGVSGDGSVIVGFSDSDSGKEAIRWTQSDGMVGLGHVPGGDRSYGSGVSADGSVIVGYNHHSDSHYEAFRWTQSGGMVGLGDLPGGVLDSRGWNVSADGSVVVGEGTSDAGIEAFRWTQSGGMVGLGDLPGGTHAGIAFAVSTDGSVIVGKSHSMVTHEAFRWTQQSGMVGLGIPTGKQSTRAFDVSSDGSIVVGGVLAGGVEGEGFVWDETNGMRDLKTVLVNDFGLNLTGWTLFDARGVSDDGRTVVGFGENPSGDTEAWIAYMSDAVYWWGDASGVWGAVTNWTGPRVPAASEDVVIAPDSLATVTGPTHSTTVKSLSIGGGVGAATVRTDGGGNLTVTNAVTVSDNGTLKHEVGTFSCGSLDNQGKIRVSSDVDVTGLLVNDGETHVFAGGTVTTDGILTNSGSLSLYGGTLDGFQLTNDFGATFSARGTINCHLLNRSLIELTGVLTVNDDVNNIGEIRIQSGQTLRHNSELHNHGTIDLDGGSVTGNGTLHNRAGGIIRGGSSIASELINNGLIHADGSSTLLIDDMGAGGNDGEIRVDDGAGVRVVSEVDNNGEIILLGAGATFAGGQITNYGTIRGQGRVANVVANKHGATIRAEAGVLTLAGSTTNLSGGIMEILNRASLSMTGGLATNNGTIILRGGTLDNGNESMTNAGQINGHGTFRSGELTNTDHVAVGGGDMEVIGDVINNSTFDVASGRTAVFFGDVSGTGSFTGGGTVVFLGKLSPGGSPGQVTFGGDVVLTGGTTLEMELGGTSPGSEYDNLDVGGELTLGGALDVVLYDEFTPHGGDTFDLFDWGTVDGSFHAVNLPALPAGLAWDTSGLYATGQIAAVPEPSSLTLLLACVLLLPWRRRRT